MLKKTVFSIGVLIISLLISTNMALASLTNATVDISPEKTGAPVQFTIGFYVGSSGALEGGRDEIILYFPEGTVFPDSLSDNIGTDSILINGISVDPRSLYHNETRLIITLPRDVDVRANGYVGIIISPSAGIELPRKAGKHYLEIETSRERSVKTNTFTIEGSKISQLEISGSPAAVDEFTALEISFRTSFRGQLVADRDKIYLEFPPNFYLPRNITNEDIEVNGKTVSPHGVTVNNDTNTLQITVPDGVDIDEYDTVEIAIDSRAGIRNPRERGVYRINVYTSADTISVGDSYDIGMAIGSPVVLINPNEVGKDSQYTIGFTTSIQGTLNAGKDEIYLEFPEETYIPSRILTRDVTVNGRNAYDVETSPKNNTVTLTVPNGVRIDAGTYVNIVIKSEAGIENPNKAGEYQIEVSTTTDKNKVKSKPYTVMGTSADSPTVTKGKGIFLTSYKPEETTSLQISFQEGNLGDLREGDKINLIFPVAYTFSGKINEQYVTINGTEAEELELIGQTLVITVPDRLDLSREDLTEIKIGSQVGIKNPKKEGNYSILLCSSLQYEDILNYTVKISGSAVGNDGERPFAELSSKEAGQSSSYLVFFVNDDSGTLTEEDTIILSFPTGTRVPESLSRSYVKINGEVPKRVRVSGNRVIFELPSNMEIAENASITILIEEDAGIINPMTGADYNLVVETSIGYFALSEEYTIGKATGPNDEETGEGREEGVIVFKIDSKIAYNGNKRIDLDTAPTILDSYTVVPLRALGDALGAETKYEDATRTVTVKYGAKELVFYIDSKLVKVNNEWKVIDIPATLINNRVMIPARFVSESFGAAVVWEAETQEVIITK